MAHLTPLWRHGDAERGSTSRLDQAIISPLLKSATVSAEVSDVCRHTALTVVETLAVCYADELVPNNELAITSLLVHALGVMSCLARGRKADAANAAASAAAFLQRNGSALTERLIEYLKEVAEIGTSAVSASGGGGGPLR